MRAQFPWLKSGKHLLGFCHPQDGTEHYISFRDTFSREGLLASTVTDSQILNLLFPKKLLCSYLRSQLQASSKGASSKGAALNSVFTAPSSVKLDDHNVEENELLVFTLH